VQVVREVITRDHRIFKELAKVLVHFYSPSLTIILGPLMRLVACTPSSPLRDICLDRVSRAGQPSVDNLILHFRPTWIHIRFWRNIRPINIPLCIYSVNCHRSKK
jgi:hypothetical protein